MTPRNRFLAGMAGVCLGNGTLALCFLLDQTLLSSFRLIALAGTAVGAAGAAAIVALARANPDEFDFSDTPVQRYAPTLSFVSGIALVFAGLLNLALVLVG